MKTSLIVNNYELTLAEDIAVPLNFAIQDFRNPEKRKRSFSKTITINGTSENLIFFKACYNLNFSIELTDGAYFKPNQAPAAEVRRSSLTIFRGKLRLDKIVLNSGVYRFECTLFSNAVDIFQNLKNIKLSELNWSEYNHQLTRTNVIKSWNTSVIKNNVETNNFTNPGTLGFEPLGFGYVYPIADYGYTRPDNITWRTNQLVPHVYVLECVKKILDYAYKDTGVEVNYDTNFFSNPNLKKLIYGYGGGEQLRLSPAQLSAAAFSVSNISYSGVRVANGEWAERYYYTHRYRILAPIYTTSATISQNVNYLTQSPYKVWSIKINQKAQYKLDVNINITVTCANSSTDIHQPSGFSVRVSNEKGYVQNTQFFTMYVNETRTINYTCDLNSDAGVYYMIDILSDFNTFDETSIVVTFNDIDVNLTADSSAVISDNTLINVGASLPTITCAEFLKGVLDLFYCVISDPIYDPITSKSYVYIDSFRDFYKTKETAIDWSDKIDNSQDIEIQCNSLIEGKNYIFRFNEEKDFFNLNYKSLTGLNYGERTEQVDTWQTGDKIVKLPFSTYQTIKDGNIIYPSIVDSQNGVIKPFKGGGALYFYNGLRTSATIKIMNSDNTTFTTSFVFPFVHNMRFGPYDDFTNVLFDFHFYPRQYALDGINLVPDLNTFTLYYSQFINEITSEDSKLITLYLKLNDSDISQLDFSKLIKLNHIFYRLFSIKDYDSDKLGTTQCELIKYLE